MPAPARQIADAIVISQGEQIEILLSPEELGRVRISLSGERGQVSIWAERAETLDLLRRNADSLTLELDRSGFGGAALAFRHGEGWAEADRRGAESEPEDRTDPAPALPRLARAGQLIDPQRRIDIRI